MQSFIDRLVIIHTSKHSDNSLVVKAFGRATGLRGFYVKGAGKNIQLLQPLGVVEAKVTDSGKSSLLLMGHIEPLFSLAGTRAGLSKSAITLFISEVLLKTLEEAAPDEALYDFVEGQTRILDSLEEVYASFHIEFLTRYASALGFEPASQSLLPFAEGVEEPLLRFISLSPTEALAMPLDGATRSKMASSLIRYISFCQDRPLEIRSLDVLKDIFR